MKPIKIAVLNHYSGLAREQVKSTVAALQKQVSIDFAPAWGIDAEVTFYDSEAPPAGAWQLIILDNSDQANALGYHDLTADGQPLGKVFAGSDIRAGYSWSVTASHELLEMLGDPDINLTVFVEDDKGGGVLYAYENCDACENDSYGYKTDGVLVSDLYTRRGFNRSARRVHNLTTKSISLNLCSCYPEGTLEFTVYAPAAAGNNNILTNKL